jgi:hypothetical protein
MAAGSQQKLEWGGGGGGGKYWLLLACHLSPTFFRPFRSTNLQQQRVLRPIRHTPASVSSQQQTLDSKQTNKNPSGGGGGREGEVCGRRLLVDTPPFHCIPFKSRESGVKGESRTFYLGRGRRRPARNRLNPFNERSLKKGTRTTSPIDFDSNYCVMVVVVLRPRWSYHLCSVSSVIACQSAKAKYPLPSQINVVRTHSTYIL